MVVGNNVLWLPWCRGAFIEGRFFQGERSSFLLNPQKQASELTEIDENDSKPSQGRVVVTYPGVMLTVAIGLPLI